ncbi:MAG: VIT1/CCC1 transporter family protein [Gammaproteobacteria bacterium]|nr:VIT1/CCC1 transporter family protein [Gammaproteobacteria bacterium]
MSDSESWAEEKRSATLYRVMAEVEDDPAKVALFTALAHAAETQAGLWERRMREHGEPVPMRLRPTPRQRVIAWLLRRLGPRAIRPALAAMKIRGLSVYTHPAPGPGHAMPASVEEIGSRHSGLGRGGNLRAAVFGVNDGLVSNTCLLLGVAGAAQSVDMVLLAGSAGLLAGAASMAAGEYISVRSQRELYEYQIGLERDELDEYPQEEAEELALIYNARGLDLAQAREFAARLLEDRGKALDALAREELGLDPSALGSPLGAAAASFVSFAAGALIPLIPFLLGSGGRPVEAMIALSLSALFGIGALLSLFTGRGALRSGLRMMLIGAAAGLATYLIGHWLGAALA